MADRSFLGDMLTTLFERRSWRVAASDQRSIEEMCLALLDAEGEVSGLRLGQAILERYAALDPAQKLAFFAFLTSDLDVDPDAIATTLETYRQTRSPEDHKALMRAAEPRRQELLRRLNQPPNATHRLVQMRADLLQTLRENPDFRRTDHDFRHLLRSWFNRGFLVLRQISWDTSANILEKIVAYEAVHAIDDWDDLRRRLYPEDRRCFAYFHPTMPDEPLIFVEVALTMQVPGSIQHLLADDRDIRAAEDTRVAVFYSISNCQKGLNGITFGNLLIKQVVAELRAELPNLETFVTLSPMPGMNAWLAEQDDATAQGLLEGAETSPEAIEALAASYLLEARTETGKVRDPVARFHLGNGAQIHAVHAGADTSPAGQRRSSGAMVNYHYDLDLIEKNHEAYVLDGVIATAPGFRSPQKANKQRTRA